MAKSFRSAVQDADERVFTMKVASVAQGSTLIPSAERLAAPSTSWSRVKTSTSAPSSEKCFQVPSAPWGMSTKFVALKTVPGTDTSSKVLPFQKRTLATGYSPPCSKSMLIRKSSTVRPPSGPSPISSPLLDPTLTTPAWLNSKSAWLSPLIARVSAATNTHRSPVAGSTRV